MTGMPSNGESMRSSTPPVPGSNAPVSFTDASRLSRDSIRSPIMPAIESTTPKTRAACGDRALDALVRADLAGELVPPPGAPAEVGPRVAQDHAEEREEHEEDAGLGDQSHPANRGLAAVGDHGV